MAYKSNGGCTPITAKIKRTTKGGITQPLLNVGAPVKMKMSSPAKQTNAQDFSSQYEAQQKAKADQKAKAIKAKKEKDAASYNQRLDSYRSNVLSLDSDTKRAASNKNPKEMDILMRAANRKSKNIQKFEKNLFDYDTKKNPKLTEGYTAKSYALSKAKGDTKKIKTTSDSSTSDSSTSGSSTSGSTKKYKTSMKNFKVGSQARRDEYTRRGWKQDETTKVAKKKAEPVSTITTKPVSIDNKASVDVVKATKKTTTKKDARKNKSIDKKQNKADIARAKGNEKKALRKERAIEKKKARLSKRKGSSYSQSANAIDPS